jgi:DNA replication protein DnaC
MVHIRTCPRCGGRSLTPTGEVCWHCEERAREPKRLSANERILMETIPDRFRWATIDAPELAARVVGGLRRIDEARTATSTANLVLSGKAGTGKTSLACAALRAWQQTKKRRAVFVAATELAHARMQHALGSGEADLVERCGHADLLLLDDLGAEPSSPPRSEIADVIQRRHNYNLPTWVTTGLITPELTTRYGFGITRRILEHATVIRLERP